MPFTSGYHRFRLSTHSSVIKLNLFVIASSVVKQRHNVCFEFCRKILINYISDIVFYWYSNLSIAVTGAHVGRGLPVTPFHRTLCAP